MHRPRLPSSSKLPGNRRGAGAFTRALLFGGLLSLRLLSAATDVRVDFTLNTTDADGGALREQRSYYVYRPDNLARTAPVPMVLVMDGGIASQFRHQADLCGFLVVSCNFTGNSLGNVWNNDNPRITGFEDYDYTSAVIARVAAAENASDAFICGLSKGGHMAYAFACERPGALRAACSVDEFMGLTSNIPWAPLPVMAIHGTRDANVAYTMGRDSIDAWRARDALLGATAVTTCEASALIPGQVTQTTWRGGVQGTQVAFVTIIGGDHRWPLPTVQTGFDGPAAVWTFFSQFLTPRSGPPKIMANPVSNTQVAGQPASFWVTAAGEDPLQYQWQRNGTAIPGATNNWYTVPTVGIADQGATYRAVVTNAKGSTTSGSATLTVATAAGITFTRSPADQTVVAGRSATFAANATSDATVAYQWRKNGMVLPGATTATLQVPVALPSDSGATFSVVATSGGASLASVPATLTVTPAPGGPIVLTNPERVRILVGDRGTFAVTAWSATPVAYQWQKGTFFTVMADIPGATSASYTTPPGVLEDHHALFRCVVSNAAGSAVSASEMLFVTTAATAPKEMTTPLRAYTAPTAPFSYQIGSSGGTAPMRYGATGLPAGLAVDTSAGVISGTVTKPGVYPITISATNSVGSTSAVLVLTVASLTLDGRAERLSNLATRGLVGSGEKALIAGFVVSGTAPHRILLRAIGPGLARFGVTGTLADPVMTLLDVQGRVLLTVDDWSPGSGADVTADAVGAFALDRGSRDAATVVTLDPGNYTLRVEGAGGTARGVALVEVYDADPAASASRLFNLSTRGIAGTDQDALIAGFVLRGSAPRTVLVRAVGAGTLGAFGIADGLGDAALELYDSDGRLIATNDDWGRSLQTSRFPQIFSAVGAFPLAGTSKDAALLQTLAPGAYTAKVVNRDQPEGVALVEVYEAPDAPDS